MYMLRFLVGLGLFFGLCSTIFGQPLEVWLSGTFAESFNEAIQELVLEWQEKTGIAVNLSLLPDKIFK